MPFLLTQRGGKEMESNNLKILGGQVDGKIKGEVLL